MPVPEGGESFLSRLIWLLTSAWLYSSSRDRFKVGRLFTFASEVGVLFLFSLRRRALAYLLFALALFPSGGWGGWGCWP